MTSLIGAYENRKYGPRVADVEVRRPLFVLGHWRSGTTHFHNLLAQDEQFAYPNMWQALNPPTFLSTELYSAIMKLAVPKTRLMDNVTFAPNGPHEDEFATCSTLCSPCVGWIFPRWAGYYDRYLTFRAGPEDEVDRWKAALMLLYKKLTWKFGRPSSSSHRHTRFVSLYYSRCSPTHASCTSTATPSPSSSQPGDLSWSWKGPLASKTRAGRDDAWIIGRYRAL